MDNYPVAWLNDTLVDKIPDTISGTKKFSIYHTDKPFIPSLQPAARNVHINIIRFSPNSFALKINSPSPAYMSIFQQYNHNWKATVNGSATQVFKTNIAFMSVLVPQGESIVELVYKPARVITAMWLSLIVILGIALLYILTAIKTRKQ